MSNYNPPYTFVPNTLIQSAQVNSNFSAISTVVNGNLTTANLSPTAGILGTQLSASANILGSQLSPTAGITPGQLSFSTASLINTGRLYGVTGQPYSDTSSGGTATIFFGPTYLGNSIAIENVSTTSLVVQTFSEASLSVGALGTGAYDVYVSSASSSTVTLSTTAWSNATTPPSRGVDIAGRTTASGNAGALLVAAVYVISNLTYNYTGRRLISNVFNRVAQYGYAFDSTASWTISQTVFGPSNSNTTDGVGRINTFSVGALQPIELRNVALLNPTDGVGDSAATAIGVDSTTVGSSSAMFRVGAITGAALISTGMHSFTATGLIGLHYFQRLEVSNTGTAASGGNNPLYLNAGNCTYLEATIYG